MEEKKPNLDLEQEAGFDPTQSAGDNSNYNRMELQPNILMLDKPYISQDTDLISKEPSPHFGNRPLERRLTALRDSINTSVITASARQRLANPISEHEEIIHQTHSQIHALLTHLNDMHNSIIQRYEKDFLVSYKEHMTKVQCELLFYKKKTSDFYLKMKKEERVSYLESTLSWFRDEALKLAESIDKLRRNNHDLKERLEVEQKEKTFMKEAALAMKRQNRLLQCTVEKLKCPEVIEKYAKRATVGQPNLETIEVKSSFSGAKDFNKQLPLQTPPFSYHQRVNSVKQSQNRVSTAKNQSTGGRIPHSESQNNTTTISFSHHNLSKAHLPYGNKRTIDFSLNLEEIHDEALPHHKLNDTKEKSELEFFEGSDDVSAELKRREKVIAQLQRRVQTQEQALRKEARDKSNKQMMEPMQAEIQNWFFECVQAVLKETTSTLGFRHLTDNSKKEVLYRFVSNKKVLELLHEIMSKECRFSNEVLPLKKQQNQNQNYIRSKSKPAQANMSLSQIEKDALLDLSLHHDRVHQANIQRTISKQISSNTSSKRQELMSAQVEMRQKPLGGGGSRSKNLQHRTEKVSRSYRIKDGKLLVQS